ncbi:glutamyl-tRNA amidotransferase [Hypoxylon trugodes]|uniref:glutamyl-tRNA amidotransferase n=1 Tax=Hypoxylon trugodes TaxID=326681 RepID=UPI0021A05C33|nr:glutamyl-tRNA amidotransferase [Hypoxylon trugodes]KAI1386431.1 glutamyl-tRNA amidotransferase [Hypoxylon trugodes]
MKPHSKRTMKALILLSGLTIASASLISTGVSMKLDDFYYFVSPFSQGKAYDGSYDWSYNFRGSFGLVPVSVVANYEDSLQTPDDLFAEWSRKDDVWQPGFAEILLVGSSNYQQFKSINISANAESTILPLSNHSNIASGPYFLDLSTGELHQALRLYNDFSGAFTQSLLQKPTGDFQILSAQVPAAGTLTIGVPSRLYFSPSEEKPLAGVRVAVKDIYSLAGVRSSYGSRAYYGLYPPANETGTAIQNLIDAGAIIVGTQKPSQFANGEVATSDWVDFHAPFNPRGDGYQDTASSSAGAGSSEASYEWLDLAVGSDTGGSVRGPAGVQGLFGNRPTHDLVSLDHVMPLSPAMDTSGFLARDPYLLDVASKALYKDNYTSYADRGFQYPKKIYVLDFPTTNTSSAQLIHTFSRNLASYLNTSITPLSLDDAWQASAPDEYNTRNISEFLNLTYSTLITKDQTRLLRDPFYKDYASVHDGRLPFIDPVPLMRWAWGDALPGGAYEEAVNNKAVFSDWINSQILPPASNTSTCSSAILLHTDSTGYFSARDTYLSPPSAPLGFSNGEISIFSGAPDTVFPIGEVPSFSSITNHTEYLPVTIDVMVARGCDGMLNKLAQDLVKAGIISIPKTGSTLHGGEILARRW